MQHMQHLLADRLTATHVRAVVAADGARDALAERVRVLRDDGERGAQAAEYAMLGGVSAAACTGLVKVVGGDNVVGAVCRAVVSALLRAIRSWF